MPMKLSTTINTITSIPNSRINKVFIDGSQPGFIRSLKIAIGEYAQYEYFVEKLKQDNRPLHLYMNIVPVNFSTKHRARGNVHKWIVKGHVCQKCIDTHSYKRDGTGCVSMIVITISQIIMSDSRKDFPWKKGPSLQDRRSIAFTDNA
jgi:hypothetical protein